MTTPREQALTDALVLLRARAEKEAIDIDISDFGDEWCLGFRAGQINALDAVGRALTILAPREAA